jgi:hypothetical protein
MRPKEMVYMLKITQLLYRQFVDMFLSKHGNCQDALGEKTAD